MDAFKCQKFNFLQIIGVIIKVKTSINWSPTDQDLLPLFVRSVINNTSLILLTHPYTQLPVAVDPTNI